ncbi:hypothetical protein [Shewanella algae]|uniref:hypothetical protein n=1 Tax=Shewanella algae TaxID=38313 RepID=UPI000D14C388|nr:hypothetical protein [Shewanella algae]PST68896.1 hypothetical protein AYI77_02015 [Shewanella algae]
MRRHDLGADAPDFYSGIVASPAANDCAVIREPALGSPANPYLTFPRLYHYRGGTSDRSFIAERLRVIPDADLHWVCGEYERRYMAGRGNRDSRRDANTWLHEYATQYRNRRAA